MILHVLQTTTLKTIHLINMPKRGNDNSQNLKENYDDSCMRSTVEHGVTKASNEELKRRRTVSGSGDKHVLCYHALRLMCLMNDCLCVCVVT